MKILLATDGSDYSVAAAKKSVSLLNRSDKTTIRVISVIEPLAPTAPFGVADEYYIKAQNVAREAAEQDAEEMQKILEEIAEDAAIESMVVTGRPREAIIKEAEDWGADLIVVGSHGRGFWGRMLLGSVSSAVVKHAGCSVLVVRNGGQE